MKIVTLTCCYNRSDKTLRALDSLFSLPFRSEHDFLDILVDDQSTDDTVEMVSSLFPSVNIISTTGNFYWASSIRFGYESIKSYDFDALLIYNDDVIFYANAFDNLTGFYAADRILGGSFCRPGTDLIVYGGWVRKIIGVPLWFRLVQIFEIGSCEVSVLNFNMVIIPKNVLHAHGFLSPCFKHSMADFDFCLRMRKVGVKLVILPGIVGECDDSRSEVDSSHAKSRLARLRSLISIKEQPPLQRIIYCFRHAGVFFPFLILWPYFRVLFTKVSRS